VDYLIDPYKDYYFASIHFNRKARQEKKRKGHKEKMRTESGNKQ